MKQKLKSGDEYDLVSSWRKRGWMVRRAGVWKKVKRALNKRFRKEWRSDNDNRGE